MSQATLMSLLEDNNHYSIDTGMAIQHILANEIRSGLCYFGTDDLRPIVIILPIF